MSMPTLDAGSRLRQQLSETVQAIAGRRKEVLEAAGGVQHIEFSKSHRADILGKATRGLCSVPMIEVFCCLIPKRTDHPKAPERKL